MNDLHNSPAKAESWIVHRMRLPIYYEDTDFSGYVYHANYLKFFERGREELIGRGYLQELYKRGFHYVVARAELAFKRPARHGDVLEIETRMHVSPSPICVVEHKAWLAEGELGSRSGSLPLELVTASIKMVSVTSSGETRRMPQDVLDRFVAMAAGG